MLFVNYLLYSCFFLFSFSFRIIAIDYESIDEDISFIRPYLLPKKHVLLKKLDAIFSSPGILYNSESVENAGFLRGEPIGYAGRCIVTQHKEIPGYIFKFFLDVQNVPNYIDRLIKRIQGSIKLKQFIEQDPILKNYFLVPTKWIYLLPKKAYSNHAAPKKIILVAEKLPLVLRRINLLKWLTMPFSLLDQIYRLIESGLDDVYEGNMSFLQNDERLGIVDTENYPHSNPRFFRLNKNLSPKNLEYWSNKCKGKTIL